MVLLFLMDITSKNCALCKNLSTPLFMISADFFFAYLGLLVVTIMNSIGGLDRVSHFDDPTYPGGYDNAYSLNIWISIILILIPIISLIGSILLTREMRKESLHWKYGVPLIISSGIIAISFICFILSMYHVSIFQAYSFYGVLFCTIGFLVLAASVGIFFRYFQTLEQVSSNAVTILYGIGLWGILDLVLFCLILLVQEITNTDISGSLEDLTWESGSYVMVWGISIGLFIIYILILLPAVGILILHISERYRDLPDDKNITYVY